ncbi:hypothetical protein DdX_20026 [Ditylenchus destructor]|uniref:Uncharacterized protein n=1 Tax=Ditylenchus destructor TaxID=166010 RepID=A0AAD4MGW1_9BILA|nr:hypothetical protein DdX_20026 [Ditylenchus destructor]
MFTFCRISAAIFTIAIFAFAAEIATISCVTGTDQGSSNAPPEYSVGTAVVKVKEELPGYAPQTEAPPYIEENFFAELLKNRNEKSKLKADPHEKHLRQHFEIFGLVFAHLKLISKWYTDWAEFQKNVIPEAGDILERQVKNQKGERQYQLFVYIGENKAITLENGETNFPTIQEKLMNITKPVPTRVNNKLKSIYPSFSMDLIVLRGKSQKTNFPLPVQDVTSEEFVNWVVYSKPINTLKERMQEKASPEQVDLRMFIYHLNPDGYRIAFKAYVNIVDIVSDTIASDKETEANDISKVKVLNLESSPAPKNLLKKATTWGVPAADKRGLVTGVEIKIAKLNVRKNEKLWIIVGFDHDSSTMTYFVDLNKHLSEEDAKNAFEEAKDKTLALRTNPKLKYHLEWLPNMTGFYNKQDAFWTRVSKLTEDQRLEENKVMGKNERHRITT